jgi:hypothetical protein
MRLLLLLLLGVPARADLGPKPTEDFRIVGAGGLSLREPASLLLCEQPDCSDAKPLGQVGPQHFSCGADSCGAQAYGFSPFQRLSLTFSDGKVSESGVFQESRALEAVYEVSLEGEGLSVREVTPASAGAKREALTPPTAPVGTAEPEDPFWGVLRGTRLQHFPAAAAATLVVELLLAALYVLVRKSLERRLKFRLLLSVLGANVLSLPVLWFILPLVVRSIFLQELCVWLFEAGFLYALNREALSLRAAAGLALALNLASALCDLALFILYLRGGS